MLYQLAQSSEARCSDTALLIEDLKQKASEYEAEGENLTDSRVKCSEIWTASGFDSKSVLVGNVSRLIA